MAVRTELDLRLPNSPGALASVCRALADARVGVVAATVERSGQVRLVVDNPIAAKAALEARHHQVIARDVLVLRVSNDRGALAPVLELVASAGVNVEYAYGAAPEDGRGGLMILGVDDPQRAAMAAGV